VDISFLKICRRRVPNTSFSNKTDHKFNPNDPLTWDELLNALLRAKYEKIASLLELKKSELPRLEKIQMNKDEKNRLFYMALRERLIHEDFDKNTFPTKGEATRLMSYVFNLGVAKNGLAPFQKQRFKSDHLLLRSEFAGWFINAYELHKARHKKDTNPEIKKGLFEKVTTLVREQIYGSKKLPEEAVDIYSVGSTQEFEKEVIADFSYQQELLPANKTAWNPVNPDTTRTPIQKHLVHDPEAYTALFKNRKFRIDNPPSRHVPTKEWNPLNPKSERSPIQRKIENSPEEQAAIFEDRPSRFEEKREKEWNQINSNSGRNPMQRSNIITNVEIKYSPVVRHIKTPEEDNYLASSFEENPKERIIFEDVTYHWAREYIDYLYELGIVEGKSDQKFHPDDFITRAELVKIAGSLSEKEISENEQIKLFEDVSQDAWYAPFIRFAQLIGAIEGREGKFYPDEYVTRAAALKVIIELATFDDVKQVTSAPFLDAPADAWFAKHVAYAKENGFLKGIVSDEFRPGDNITRAEVALVVSRVIYEKQKKRYLEFLLTNELDSDIMALFRDLQ